MANELHREISTFLKEYGAKNVHFVPGGKHPRVVFNFKGEERFTVVPSSASDRRAIDNQLADIKRMLGPPIVAPVLQKRKLEEMSPAPKERHAPRHFVPFVNAPGEFQMIPLAVLHIDERYQRTCNKNAVERIARNWSWPSCGVLLVSHRDPGGYFVFDGQHRVEAAKLAKNSSWGQVIDALPCLVFKALPFKDEAKGFLGANTERRPMYVAQQYNALLITGDEIAKKVEELMQVSGRKVSQTAGPHTISCISRIMRCMRADEEALRRVWPLINLLLKDRLFHERVVTGVFELERRMPEGRSLAEGRHTSRLATVGADAIIRAIHNSTALEGNRGSRAVAAGVAQAYNRGNRTPLRFDLTT